MSIQVNVEYKVIIHPRSKNKLRMIPEFTDELISYIEDINFEQDYEVISFDYRYDEVVFHVLSNGNLSPRQLVFRIKGHLASKLRENFVQFRKIDTFWLRGDVIESVRSSCQTKVSE